MTEHLPECHLATDCKHDYYNEPPVQCANCGEVCICDLLRACEQRVAKEYRNREMNGLAWTDGYDHGVQDAREAVAALPMMKIAGNFPLYDADDVVAAIDALKENP